MMSMRRFYSDSNTQNKYYSPFVAGLRQIDLLRNVEQRLRISSFIRGKGVRTPGAASYGMMPKWKKTEIDYIQGWVRKRKGIKNVELAKEDFTFFYKSGKIKFLQQAKICGITCPGCIILGALNSTRLRVPHTLVRPLSRIRGSTVHANARTFIHRLSFPPSGYNSRLVWIVKIAWSHWWRRPIQRNDRLLQHEVELSIKETVNIALLGVHR